MKSLLRDMANVEAPWYRYRKWLNAMFGNDPAITVGEVEETTEEGLNYAVTIEVQNYEKYVAMDRLLETRVEFGKVVLGIHLVNAENPEDVEGIAELYETIFTGNPILRDVKVVPGHAGVPHGFVRFQPELIQFPDDNLCDFDGNWNGLAQGIAKTIFKSEFRGVNFCTASLHENGDGQISS